jgi:acetyl esterase
MPVIGQLKPFFDGLIASSANRDDRPPAEARAAMHAMIESSFNAFVTPRDPLPSETDHDVPVVGGSIRVRIYRPKKSMSPLPCHINFHGGGFWLGTIDHGDPGCRSIASAADCVVVSVDYRLAPEHKFPTATEDCYAALVWVAEHALELGIEPSRISVGGGSAGANLAAVVALMARDRGGPSIVFQILEIPVTDLTKTDPLVIAAEDLVVPMGKEQYRAYYLNDLSEATSPYASPLLAPDLSGLPPALVMTAEYDGLQPEGEAYAKRLAEFGVSAEYHCWKGQFHGSQNMAALIPEEATKYQARIVSALRNAYTVAA